MPPRRSRCRGYALVDALVAMALLLWVALAAAALVHGAVGRLREADRLDRARDAAQSVLARLETVPFHSLAEEFGAAETDSLASLDTAAGTAPPDWRALVEGLPEGRLSVRLEGLGRGGASAPFGEALALRLRAETAYRIGRGATRRVRVVGVRF